MSGPGDVGRRLRRRRQQLGLSHDEVARRARMAPSYLAYVESSPADVSPATLTKLARVLDINRDELLGGGREHAEGTSGRSARPELRDLPHEVCLRRLAAGGVGRVVFMTDSGPEVLPVNFTMDGDAPLFRTTDGSPVARHALGGAVAFEVDRIDDASAEGWSVVVHGKAERADDPTESDSGQELSGPHPWAGGDRALLVRVRPASMTGREIIQA